VVVGIEIGRAGETWVVEWGKTLLGIGNLWRASERRRLGTWK
jgi:hypothetical protein